MTQLKDLYKGQSLADLEKYFSVPDIKKAKLRLILNTCQKMYDEAEKKYLERDEEMSYILFMRYFAIVKEIRKRQDYDVQKKYISEMLGSNAKIGSALEKTETLSNSLRKRYKILSELADDSSIGIRQSHTFEKRGSKVSDDSTNMIVDDDMGRMFSIIACNELAKMIRNRAASLLIMDCRTKKDFINSNIAYTYSINIPEECLLPGMSAGTIQQQLDENTKAKWASRGIKDYVVLMDWKSKGPEPAYHTPIWYLKDILLNWDQDVNYKSPIRILEGGYENFILLYPMLCTNPNVQSPKDVSATLETLDDIEYPSIHDIIMKNEFSSTGRNTENDKSSTNQSLRPSIDRKSKEAAIRAYDERQRKIELVQERERITEKMQQIARERLEAENKWNTVSQEKNKLIGQEENSDLIIKEQQLLFKIMQLENNERDYKWENEMLREKLEEYKRREKESGELISENEAENIEQATKRIEVKIEESKLIDRERERITKERQKELAFAREHKRHLKPPTDEDSISKPKIPQFDRSVKPVIQSKPAIIQIQRDFSPIYGSVGKGLTGLKNLGNTCYMNSILQCLSNTSSLVNYFITQDYKKHINNSNKTQGRIVEEVAALIAVLWSGQYKCVASKDLRYVLGQYQQIFRGIEQQDSHEFLTILMDWLHSDLQTLQIKKPLIENLSASDKAWLEYTKSRESLILRLFYGQIKSTVKCTKCGKESATYECFSNLSLELPPTSERCILRDCLDMYFNGESIQGWDCPSCKEKRNAIKKLDISILPPILVVHFKRFYADTDSMSNTYKKKQNYVSFPLLNLNMGQYTAPSVRKAGINKTYHLYGVSNHYGSMECGHYTAFCKSSSHNKWFKFDDQIVSSLDSSDVISSAAYILFYTFLEDTPPQGEI